MYSAAGIPVWYTLQSGQWVTSTRWTGKVYATIGPPFFAPTFDPAQVIASDVGTASIEFAQKPGEVGFATLSYTVGDKVGSTRITRLMF